MAKQNQKIDPVYSHLVIRKPFAISLFFTCSVIFAMLTISFFTGLTKDAHWTVLAITGCSICSVLIAFPPVENWAYNAWQKQAQKIEQHHYD